VTHGVVEQSLPVMLSKPSRGQEVEVKVDDNLYRQLLVT